MEFISTDHPIENEYPKLVRDNIPAIIKARTGVDAELRIAKDDREFLDYLLRKMVEEATELEHSGEHDNLEEELADVCELIETILKLKGKTQEDILAIQRQKREKNGGFNDRIIMLSKIQKPE